MEAKDTMMSEKQLQAVEDAYVNEDFSVNVIRLERGHTEVLRLRIAQAQAEKTAPIFFAEGYKAGIEMMVEFVIGDIFPMLNMASISVNFKDKWNAKLKECEMDSTALKEGGLT